MVVIGQWGKWLQGLLAISLIGLLSGCPQTPEPPLDADPPSTLTNPDPVWDNLPGWQYEQFGQIWPALLNNCTAMLKKSEQIAWHGICEKARNLSANTTLGIPDHTTIKQFIEQHFYPERWIGSQGEMAGFMTGYYEPLLQGSYQADEHYRYAIYTTPSQMLSIELGDLYPELKGKRVRGRLVEGNRVVPFYDRAAIESAAAPLKGQEILWVDNRDDLFFLHIQGSGRVQLPDGSIIGVGYANQNGHPYIAIGKRLIEWGEVDRSGMNLFTLKQWLRDHPDKAERLLNENPSYVFFNLRQNVTAGPIGALNVPLTAERSIAIDPKAMPLGTLMWLDSAYPDGQPLQKLVLAQDTGGVIKGELRADFFFGTGEKAEQWAGRMKQDTAFYRLSPREQN